MDFKEKACIANSQPNMICIKADDDQQACAQIRDVLNAMRPRLARSVERHQPALLEWLTGTNTCKWVHGAQPP